VSGTSVISGFSRISRFTRLLLFNTQMSIDCVGLAVQV
jgi:hypothetical protein